MSAFKFKFFPLIEHNNYTINLMKIDHFYILIDCGWDHNLSYSSWNNIEKYMDKIGAIIISSSSIKHIGMLPFLYKELNLKCPIYTSSPVKEAGKLFLYDFYQTLFNNYTHVPFNLDDIDNCFHQIVTIKFTQTLSLKGEGRGISLTPLCSGYTLGSCIWKISKDGEGDIVYALNFNHKKQIHMNPAMIQGLVKPFIFITESVPVTESVTDKRMNKIEEFKQLLSTHLKSAYVNNSCLLILSDTAGEIFELLFNISEILNSSKQPFSDVVIFSHAAHHIMKVLTTNMDSLSSNVTRKLESGVMNFLGILNLYTCQSMEEFSYIKFPRIVICSDTNLFGSISRELILLYGANKQNIILFTSPFQNDTLAEEIFLSKKPENVSITVRNRVSLEGKELENFENNKVTLLNVEKNQYFNEETENIDNFAELSNGDDIDYGKKLFDGLFNKFFIPDTLKLKLDCMVDQHTLDYFSKLEIYKSKNSLKTYPITFEEQYKSKWDEYGQIANFEDQLDPKNKIFNNISLNANEQIVRVNELNLEKLPTKMVETVGTVFLQAQIMFIPLNNRIDWESQRRIINMINPRHLIICGGNSKEEYEKEIKSVFIPKFTEKVKICEEKQVLYTKVKESQLEILKFIPCEQFELAWVDVEDSTNTIGFIDKNFQYVSYHPLLEVYPPKKSKRHRTIFINNFQINSLRDKLEKKGIDVKLKEGILDCGCIKIKKMDENTIEMEGKLCMEYYEMKKKIYNEFMVI